MAVKGESLENFRAVSSLINASLVKRGTLKGVRVARICFADVYADDAVYFHQFFVLLQLIAEEVVDNFTYKNCFETLMLHNVFLFSTFVV